MQSVLDTTDLDEMMSLAALADRDFAAERAQVIVLDAPKASLGGALDARAAEAAERAAAEAQALHGGQLSVPRRPAWDASMDAARLDAQERSSFLEWRRGLAALEQSLSRSAGGVALTPFEKNLEVWRQLWRVLERSDAVVQVVDARDPSAYFSADLAAYARELHPTKRTLVLLNKADLLPLPLRAAWRDRFRKLNVDVAFWSAKRAAEQIKEDKKKEREREEDQRLAAVQGEDEDWEQGDDDRAPQDRRTWAANDPEQEERRRAEEAEREREENEEGEGENERSRTDGGSGAKGSESESESESDSDSESESTPGSKSASTNPGAPGKETRRSSSSPPPSSSRRAVSLNTTRILGVDELLAVLERLASSAVRAAAAAGVARASRGERLVVGLTGYPNVGKSSTINAVFGSKKTAVAATPGKTKHFQTLVVSRALELCDCPGLVLPRVAASKAEMVAAGVVPIDRLTDVRVPIQVVAARVGAEQLRRVYGLRFPPGAVRPDGRVDAAAALRALAASRGWAAAGGLPDETRAGRKILKDYVDGKLLWCRAPPDADEQARKAAQTVAERGLADGDREDDEGHENRTEEHAAQGRTAAANHGNAPAPARDDEGDDLDAALFAELEGDVSLLPAAARPGRGSIPKARRPAYKFHKKTKGAKLVPNGAEDTGEDGTGIKRGKRGGFVGTV